MFRAEQEAGTEFGRRVGEIMATGQLVPDELTIAMIEERLGRDDARDGFVLDGFPRNLAQAEALDAMLGGIGRGLDAILFFDVPDEVGMERALSRAELENRLDDTPRRDREAPRDLPLARPSRSSSTTARPASSCRCTATRSIDEVWAEVSDGAQPGRSVEGRAVIIRKSEAEIETMARAGRVVADTLALLEERIQPGVTTSELDRVAEEFIRSRGGEPTFKGYKGYPAATCLSPNDMVVHGIPGAVHARRRATSSRSTSA